jgi:hypothetical protein
LASKRSKTITENSFKLKTRTNIKRWIYVCS